MDLDVERSGHAQEKGWGKAEACSPVLGIVRDHRPWAQRAYY